MNGPCLFPANLITVILNISTKIFILTQSTGPHDKTNVQILGPESLLFRLYNTCLPLKIVAMKNEAMYKILSILESKRKYYKIFIKFIFGADKETFILL